MPSVASQCRITEDAETAETAHAGPSGAGSVAGVADEISPFSKRGTLLLFALAGLASAACGRESARSGDTTRGSGDSTAPSAGAVTTAQRDCGLSSNSGVGSITPDGLGRLRVGEEISGVRAACTIVHDTVIPGPEGTRERRVAVALGADTVQMIVDGERIWRIEVATPRFRTADSLGVGSLATQLKRGRGHVATGEGNVAVVRDDHCGLSFFVRGASPTATWATIPSSASVYRVLIYGCPKAPPAN